MRSASDLGIPGFETVTVLDDSRDTVLRARDLQTDADVVIKLLDRAKEPVLPKRFNRLRKELAKLTEQRVGLIPLLATGVASDGRDYIVVRYYPIGNLQDQVSHGPTPWYLAAEMMAEVTKIVGLAHDKEVVIGDLRPSNIYLEAVGTPAIAAFGVATRRFDDGKPSFVAPEAAGDHPEPSPASDVYSLALTLAALITGRAWARGESRDDFMAEVTAMAPPRIINVIEHGLSVSPANRYRNASTMQRAIRAAMDADPDAVTAEDSDEPFDFDTVFEVVDNDRTAATSPGIPLATNHETLPPGLEDILFVCRDVEDDDDEPAELVEEEDIAVLEDSDLEDSDLEDSDVEDSVLNDLDLQDPALDELDEDELHEDELFENELTVDQSDEDQLIEDEPTIDLTEPPPPSASDFVSAEGPEDDRPGSSPSGGDGGTRSATSTLVRDVRSIEDADRELVLTDAMANLNDETSVLKFDDLQVDEPLVEDPDLAAEFEDQTSILNLDDLTTTGEFTAEEFEKIEDATSILDLDDLSDAQDQTSVLDLDDLGSDQTSVLDLDELGSDQTSVLDLDELRDAAEEVDDDAEDMLVAGTAVAFENDLTDVFGDSPVRTDLPSPNGFVPGENSDAGGFEGVVGPDGEPLEDAPFRGVTPVNDPYGAPTFIDRTRTSAEVIWFRRRRSVATSAAMFGILAIVAVVIFFLAKEVRTSSKIEAEGISVSTTTIQTEVTQLATNVPSVTAPPPPSTTVPPPRRPAQPAAPVTEAKAKADDGDKDADTDPKDEGDKDPKDEGDKEDDKGEEEPEGPSNEAPDPDGEPGDGGPAGPTTAPEPTTAPPEEGPPTTLEETPEPTAPPVTEPPPTEPPTTVAPPANNARPSLALDVVGLSKRRVSIAIGSDQCVAVRYVLSGNDGSNRQGSSNGYNPEVQCSTAWDLPFDLTPDSDYTVKVWVKGLESGKAKSSQVSFSTED